MRLPRLSTRAWMMVLALLCALWIGAESSAIVRRQGVMLPNSILPVGRDFVVFYSAAKIITAGDGAELYDVERQQEEISRVVGYDSFHLPYAYPAFFALLYVPLSALPYLWAYGFALAGMVAALIGAALVLRTVSPTARRYPVFIILALLAYLPITWATFGGLNVGLTLLCLAGAYSSLIRQRQRTAGVLLGCLLFKPQIALPMLGLMAWRRQWRVLMTALAIGGALTFAAAALVAPTWPLDFARLVLSDSYHKNELECCGGIHVGLPSVAAYALPHAGMLQAAIVGLGVGAAALTLRACRGSSQLDARFPLQFGLVLAVAISWSPHALFYETGLLTLPILALIDSRGAEKGFTDTGQRLSLRYQLLLAALYAGGVSWPFDRSFGFQPMVVIPLLVAVLCWNWLRGLSEPASSSALPARPVALTSAAD